MAKADSTQDSKHGVHTTGLRFTEGLQFKLAALFLLALILLSAGAFLASRTLVKEELIDEGFRYQQESGLRLRSELRTLIDDVQSLADTLAVLAADPALRIEQLRNAGPALLKHRNSADLVATLGIWPEPRQLAGAGERSSLYWLREANGALIIRNDYNDARSAPYFRERWYTPARYLSAGRGYWSDQRREPLLNREVLTYTVPILVSSSFSGVVTVSIDVKALNDRFATLIGNTGRYALLVDGGQRLIAVSANAADVLTEKAKPGTTLAELAKAELSYGPLAFAAFKRRESQQTRITQSQRYDAKQVSALKDGTRELSRQEAGEILTQLWAAEPATDAGMESTRIALENDAVLDEPSWASLFGLHSPAWTLVLVTPANQGFSGAQYLFRQSLALTLGLVTLALLLAFLVLSALVIRPLQKLSVQLAAAHAPEDALNIVLDTSARNELGTLAGWLNERIQQLRDTTDHLRAIKSQLATESSERRAAQEQLARVQERTALMLQSVTDAVVTTDLHGQVDEMNAVAEILTAMTLREARGKPLTEVMRLHTSNPKELLNPALHAMERGSRLDYPDGITLRPASGASRLVALSSSPIRLQGRMAGALLAFHEHGTSSNPIEVQAAINSHQQDKLTGLATRVVCERRLMNLLDQIKVAVKNVEPTHALILLDVDHLKRINDSGGLPAGDDVLLRVAQTLQESAPVVRDVYRLTAGQFAVVLESVDHIAALAAAEALREKIASTHFYWESRLFSVTASFGVTLLDRKTPSPEEAIRRAYDACTAARRAGRNRVLFYDVRADRIGRFVDDETWARCIRRGLDENLFHLRTQWIRVGAEHTDDGQAYEILLALEDEEGFWASSETFMPVAERHNLARAIDLWTIENTLLHLNENPQLQTTLAFCSISLNAATVADPEFLDFITTRFEKAPQLAQKICFELHEQTLTQHPRQAALCCDVLHRVGCKLSIDHNFGGHLSELTLLRRLPINFVKLNARSFKELATDPVEKMLAESTLRIVRHLKQRVIVNHIDNATNLETWKKLGADYFQGDVIAKPALVAFLAAH